MTLTLATLLPSVLLSTPIVVLDWYNASPAPRVELPKT